MSRPPYSAQMFGFRPQPKPQTWRSEKHRRRVASMPCVCCGAHGPSQAGHVNFGKGYGIKSSDALLFPICPTDHSYHDQGGVERDERRRRELAYVEKTREDLIAVDMWPEDVEAAYQAAIGPLRAVVVPIED